ncbi:putative UDP-sugar transporter protein SLC35A4 [Reticulomyxa filosa]|uniref:Putative UDP-sugar transporter protein SLC35A4 n=1 Tax=Reticulomyxa filosa TaxID=46433 RepID=X6N683_RETFI|nr:putative UDP-sugar transporter protein SLC35A4 [Reticulomyxa filosa]|eukprot:ETO21418.1 putative UDP-sugar transporter protein SLC35A4 [Reticulomyxa filosa]
MNQNQRRKNVYTITISLPKGVISFLLINFSFPPDIKVKLLSIEFFIKKNTPDRMLKKKQHQTQYYFDKLLSFQRKKARASVFDEGDAEIEILLGKGQTTENKQEGSQLDAFTKEGVCFVVLGTLLYGFLGTVSKLSFLGEERLQYEPTSVLMLSEVFKFVVSGLLLMSEQGSRKCLTTIRSQTLKQWMMFAVPATIYSITNTLDFHIVRYMDTGSLQVQICILSKEKRERKWNILFFFFFFLQKKKKNIVKHLNKVMTLIKKKKKVLLQFKILTTAILWWYWFRKPVSKQQWIALSLLVLGSVCVSWPTPQADTATDIENVIDGQSQQMHVELPGLLYLLLQVSLSALAGVYTEAMYKQYGRDRSIHLENLSMYAWGTLSSMAQYTFVKHRPFANLLDGFNIFSWCCVGIFIGMGLVLGQVMKRFNNIVKLFMNGASIAVAGILTFFCFGTPWTVSYFIGLITVVAAVYLYRTDKIYCN